MPARSFLTVAVLSLVLVLLAAVTFSGTAALWLAAVIIVALILAAVRELSRRVRLEQTRNLEQQGRLAALGR